MTETLNKTWLDTLLKKIANKKGGRKDTMIQLDNQSKIDV